MLITAFRATSIAKSDTIDILFPLRKNTYYLRDTTLRVDNFIFYLDITHDFPPTRGEYLCIKWLCFPKPHVVGQDKTALLCLDHALNGFPLVSKESLTISN